MIPLLYWDHLTGETWEEDFSQPAYARAGPGHRLLLLAKARHPIGVPMTLTAEGLRRHIDICWEAVNASRAGPFVVGTAIDGQPAYSIVACQTFQTLLAQTLPKGPQPVEGRIEQPREPWQEDE